MLTEVMVAFAAVVAGLKYRPEYFDDVRREVNQYFVGHDAFSVVLFTLAAIIILHCVANVLSAIARDGLFGAIFKFATKILKNFSFTRGLIEKENKKIMSKMEDMVIPAEFRHNSLSSLPENGWNRDALLKTLQEWSDTETAKWRDGQMSGGVYHGDLEYLEFLVKAYGKFALSNPLHPDVFPYVRKMEAEVVRMTLSMFHGDQDTCGTMTSGGTESILMACKAYRDRARERGVEAPEMICATTAHAAFDKACHYFGIKMRHVPVDPVSFKLDVNAVRKAINKNTIIIVGSAPSFPQGVIDPIEELAALALRHDIGMHVDSCLGGFLLPFLTEAGFSVRPFDFAVPGVTSISADTHKYGYSPKGTSVVMYRNAQLRSYQYFVAAEWTGGIYASPSMPGSRPGGLIASTWAAMVTIGRKGYVDHAKVIMNASKVISEGLSQIRGIRVLGKPDMSVIAFAADGVVLKELDIYKVGEALSKRHWNLNSLQNPSSLHICVTYVHRNCAERFVSDVKDAVDQVLNNPQGFRDGSAAIYGMAASIPDKSMVQDLAKGFIDCLYKTF